MNIINDELNPPPDSSITPLSVEGVVENVAAPVDGAVVEAGGRTALGPVLDLQALVDARAVVRQRKQRPAGAEQLDRSLRARGPPVDRRL